MNNKDLRFLLRFNSGGNKVHGIFKAEHWFDGHKIIQPISFLGKSFIVGSCYDYMSGKDNHNYEGLTTLAACVAIEDAVLIFERHTGQKINSNTLQKLKKQQKETEPDEIQIYDLKQDNDETNT